jgi:hypothetical protein
MRANLPNTETSKSKFLIQSLGFFLAAFFFLTACGFTEEPTPVPVDKFHSALIDYFKVTEQQVTDASTSGVTDEEVAIAFFIAQRARLEPEAVTGIHANGLSWMQVAFHYQLNPWIFYTFLSGNLSNSPYQTAYDKFNKPTFKINLTDPDLVNLANLKFLSEYYGRDPKEIVQKRASGKTFRQINEDYWNQKGAHDYGWDVVDPNETPTPVPDFFQKITKGL